MKLLAFLSLCAAAAASAQFEATAHGKWYRNVKDYGAKGDGTTDDTSAFVTALTQGRKDERSIKQQLFLYVPPGEYKISATLRLYFYTTLMGDSNDRPVIRMAEGVAASKQVYAIEGPVSCSGCGHTDDFYYQIKNIVVDVSAPNNTHAVGIHWAVSQATMIRNVKVVVGMGDMGIFGENGSGGVMTDVEIIGGRVGISFGNQQWVFNGLRVSDARAVGFQVLWNWGFVLVGCAFANTPVAVQYATAAGALQMKDCVFTNIRDTIVWTDFPVDLSPAAPKFRSILLHNTTATGSPTLLSCYETPASVCSAAPVPVPGSGRHTYTDFALGYTVDGATGAVTFRAAAELSLARPRAGVAVRVHPQNPPAEFHNVFDSGAKGDCVADDTAALQKALDAYQTVFLPSGCFLVSRTLRLQANTRLFGAGLSEIRGNLQALQTTANHTLLATPDDAAGDVMMWDMIFTANSQCDTCRMVHWGVGNGAMWDVHFRMYNGVKQLLEVSETGGGYIENMWGWVADHEIDGNHPITVHSAEGIEIRTASAGVSLAMVGTAFEHSADYQYRVTNASHVAFVYPQSETAYWQSPPTGEGVHITGSSQVTLYGCGLYNWFHGVQAATLNVEASRDVTVFLPNVNTPNVQRTQGVEHVIVTDKIAVDSSPPFNMSGFCSHFVATQY